MHPRLIRLKGLAKRSLMALGYDPQRADRHAPPADPKRPIGDMRRFLEDLKARGLGVTSIADVGANRGDWARMALALFPDAHCLLLEPQAEMKIELEALCHKSNKIKWIMAGVGAENGSLALSIWADVNGSSFIQGAKDHAVETRTLPIYTLDELYKNEAPPKPTIVKIDVQGFELEVLKGAKTLMGQTEVFILEASLYPFLAGVPMVHELMAFMADHGYYLYDVAGWMRRPHDGALGQLDLVFAREKGVLRHSNVW